MTFEELVKANTQIKTTPIKGKNYAEVPQRIKVFRMLFPNGAIETEIVKLEDGMCVMRATATNEEGKTLGTGTAYEMEGSNFINGTSYIENCETSAVGRCLGMLGIGIDTSISSAEEVENAIHQQEMKKQASKPKIETLKKICEKHGVDFANWLSVNKRTEDTLTEEEATKMLITLKKKYGDE